MGVPFLFSHLTRKNPKLVSTSTKYKNPSVVCLDYNCVIHFCNSELKKQWEWVDDHGSGQSNYEEELINRCETYIDLIVDQFDSVDELFISIDGVPPQTKIVQQRRRRYLSIFMRSKLGNTKDWDTNAISPGTEFMKKLNKRLSSYAHSIVGKVRFSSSEEPGEGETKIFDYLAATEFSNGIFVYGLDADLIMLSLLLKKKNVFLMRESKFFHDNVIEPYIYLDIGLLSNDIVVYMKDMLDSDCLIENYIESYVLASMLVGNDFVPALSYLRIRSHSIEHILKTFSSVLKFQQGRSELIYYQLGTWKINWNVFLPLLTSLSSVEDAQYRKMHNQYFANNRAFTTEEDVLNFYGITNKPKTDVINPNKVGWRNRYYQTLFGNERIENICKNYIEGLIWNVDYYMNKSISTKWFYKYDYAPTLFDLSNYVTLTSDLDQLKPLSEQKYLPPNQHLVSILPVQSHHMLSVDDRKMTRDIENVRYFPSEYRIQTYLKTFLHECSPSIPVMKMYLKFT